MNQILESLFEEAASLAEPYAAELVANEAKKLSGDLNTQLGAQAHSVTLAGVGLVLKFLEAFSEGLVTQHVVAAAVPAVVAQVGAKVATPAAPGGAPSADHPFGGAGDGSRNVGNATFEGSKKS